MRIYINFYETRILMTKVISKYTEVVIYKLKELNKFHNCCIRFIVNVIMWAKIANKTQKFNN